MKKIFQRKVETRGIFTEDDIHKWLAKAQLSRLSRKVAFHGADFPNLRPTNWDKLYTSFQKSKAISIRVPERILGHLKIHAMQNGIPYQTLIRIWLTEMLEKLEKAA